MVWQATDSFLYHCELQGLVPEPSFMRKFEKPAVDLSHFAMGDAFGLALARRYAIQPLVVFVEQQQAF